VKREPIKKTWRKMAAPDYFFILKCFINTKHGIFSWYLPQWKRYSQDFGGKQTIRLDVYAFIARIFDFSKSVQKEKSPSCWNKMWWCLEPKVWWAADTLEESYHIEVRRLNRICLGFINKPLINSDDCNEYQDVLENTATGTADE